MQCRLSGKGDQMCLRKKKGSCFKRTTFEGMQLTKGSTIEISLEIRHWSHHGSVAALIYVLNIYVHPPLFLLLPLLLLNFSALQEAKHLMLHWSLLQHHWEPLNVPAPKLYFEVVLKQVKQSKKSLLHVQAQNVSWESKLDVAKWQKAVLQARNSITPSKGCSGQGARDAQVREFVYIFLWQHENKAQLALSGVHKAGISLQWSCRISVPACRQQGHHLPGLSGLTELSHNLLELYWWVKCVLIWRQNSPQVLLNWRKMKYNNKTVTNRIITQRLRKNERIWWKFKVLVLWLSCTWTLFCCQKIQCGCPILNCYTWTLLTNFTQRYSIT